MATAEEITQEMLERLRLLQGSGEYVPLGRRVEAGPGLQGGGTLEEDVRLDLAVEHRQTLSELKDIGLDNIATSDDLVDFVTSEQLQSASKPRVFYRDFTVGQAPLQEVVSPPIRVDEAAVITRITVTCGAPGSQSIAVKAAGEQITVAAGSESATKAVNISRAAGSTVSVSVGATNAASIVVSLRFEEK